jgi:hypothetical protein
LEAEQLTMVFICKQNPPIAKTMPLTVVAGVGAEILLGRSTGAPRIQVTRLGLIRDMLSLTGMFDVALQLRLRVP